jgi:pilus assembly protein CpaB
MRNLRSRPGLSTAVGTAFAIIAGLMLLGFVGKSLKSERGGRLITVPVARADIAMGVLITDDMLGSRQVPTDYVVPGSLRKESEATGARSIRFIGRGEPITSSSIAGGKGAANMASRIPSDLRAYSVQISRETSGATDLRPGDKVDVLATAGDPPVTRTLLSGRLILSIGGAEPVDTGERRTLATSITLLVSPGEAELLAQASSTGEISVSLCPTAPQEAQGRQSGD